MGLVFPAFGAAADHVAVSVGQEDWLEGFAIDAVVFPERRAATVTAGLVRTVKPIRRQKKGAGVLGRAKTDDLSGHRTTPSSLLDWNLLKVCEVESKPAQPYLYNQRRRSNHHNN